MSHLAMMLETIEPQQFQTQGLPEAENRALVTSLFGDIVGEVILEPMLAELGQVHGIFCRAARLDVMTCFFAPKALTIRGRGDYRSEYLLMLRSMESPLVVRQAGRELNAEAGDFLFLSPSQAYEWHLPEGGRIDCGRMPIEAFPAPRDALDRFLMRPIPKAYPPLQLLITHGAYLLMRGAHAPGEAEMIVAHFRQILPMVIDYLTTHETPEPLSVKLSKIRALIEDRLSDAEFDISQMARSFGVTPRYIQKLFQRDGTTFSQYLLERRLEIAHGLIIRQGDRRPISVIAYETGFGDLSYFNRTFRRRYGKTPSELRRVMSG